MPFGDIERKRRASILSQMGGLPGMGGPYQGGVQLPRPGRVTMPWEQDPQSQQIALPQAQEIPPPAPIDLPAPAIVRATDQAQRAAPIARKALQKEVEKAEERGLGQKVKELFTDDEKRARLTMALNTMRRRPDPHIHQMAQEQIQEARGRKVANRTVQYLNQAGREDLAQAVSEGMMDPNVALKTAFEKKKATPAATAGQHILDDFISQYGELEGSLKYEEYKQQQRLAQERAGVPPTHGEVKPSEVTSALTRVQQEIKPESEGLRTVAITKQMLDKAEGDRSGIAQQQLDRMMATLAGDKQLSIAEVNQIANAGSLPQRVFDALNRWVSGVTSGYTHEEVRAVLESMENYHGSKLNEKRERLGKAYKATRFDDETVEAILPPRWSAEEAQLDNIGTAPEGVDAKLWNVMTPGERKLWQCAK